MMEQLYINFGLGPPLSFGVTLSIATTRLLTTFTIILNSCVLTLVSKSSFYGLF